MSSAVANAAQAFAVVLSPPSPRRAAASAATMRVSDRRVFVRAAAVAARSKCVRDVCGVDVHVRGCGAYVRDRRRRRRARLRILRITV